jgi:RND family efflux transporter MFP subunit
MTLNPKAVALSLGLVSILSIVTIAQAQKPGQAETLVVDDASIDWFQKSDVSALREGVIDRMELRLGKEVGKKGDVIGYLHKEVADLAVKEAEIQARGQGAILKAKAQRRLAMAVVQRNMALLAKNIQYVSGEEREKAEAELEAAEASLIEANDTQDLAKAKLDSARRAAEEHIIRAPFAGQILEEYKHEGESVRANEPVIKLGNLDTVRVWAFIPIEYYSRIAPGSEVSIQVKLGSTRGKQPIEMKQFRGVISSVDKSIQAVGETTVRVYADLDNPTHELMPGLKATMTILLKPDGVASFASPSPVKSASSVPTSVGSRQPELPPLPR